MKRSEMVKLMWDFIQEVESDYDYYMTKDDVDTLLNRMEKAGMQPPPSPLDQNNWGVMSQSRWDEDRLSYTELRNLNKEDFVQLFEKFPELFEEYMKKGLK